MIVFLLFLSKFSSVLSNHVLEIYGDVHKDEKFFVETFPRLIKNLGGFVKVKYNLLGSGAYSVPQMCALNLSSNVFLQAEYLKCEASGVNNPETCLCIIDVDPEKYSNCVITKGQFAGEASEKYMDKYSDDTTPVVEIANRTLTGDQDFEDYFNKMCSSFDKRQPYTCSQPIQETSHKGATRFDWNNDFEEAFDSPISPEKRKEITITKKKHSMKKDGKTNNDKQEDAKNSKKEKDSEDTKTQLNEENNNMQDQKIRDKYNAIFPFIEEKLGKWLQYSI